VILLGAAGLVLLISCANVAGLLVLRAGGRGQEIGLRRALGAGPLRLVRQLLTESVVLALAGGAFGVAVAFMGVRSLLAVAPPGTIPRTEELGLDLAALAFGLAVSLVTGLVFGVAPAVASGGLEPLGGIGRATRTHTRRRGALGSAMVVAEVSLAVVLLTGAGLLFRSFQTIRSIELGFDPRGTATFYVDLPEDAYGELETAMSLHRRVLDELRATPSVQAVGGANFEPFGPLSISTTVRTEDGEAAPFRTGWMIASRGYFGALGIPLLAGRGFGPADGATSAPVVVVSRTMAERLWPTGDPVGKRITRNSGEDWLTVIGVVEDVVLHDVTAARGPLMYLPLEQVEDPRRLSHLSYVLRTRSNPSDLAPAVRSVLREADPNLPVGEITSMDRVVLASFGDRLFQVRVIGLFATLSIVLAAVGLYGVTAYSVSERKREIGIRMALGAGVSKVVGSVLARGSLLGAIGVGLGIAVSLGVGRVIQELLFGVEPGDAATLASVAALLLTVAMAASFIPARRAARVDPMTVLKEE
jgi:predicted permease